MKLSNRFTLLLIVVMVGLVGVWLGGDPRLAPARAEAQQPAEPLYVIIMTATPAPTVTSMPGATVTAAATNTVPPTPTKVQPFITPTAIQTLSTPAATQIGGTPGLPRTLKAEIDYIPYANLVVRKSPYGIKTNTRVIAGQRYFIYLIRELADGSSWACFDDAGDWQACTHWFAIRADIDGDGKLDAPYSDPAPGPKA